MLFSCDFISKVRQQNLVQILDDTRIECRSGEEEAFAYLRVAPGKKIFFSYIVYWPVHHSAFCSTAFLFAFVLNEP